MLVRIEGLAIAIAFLALGWGIVRLLRLIGVEAVWVGRGRVSFRRCGDPQPDDRGVNFQLGFRPDGDPPPGTGGASGGF